MSLPIALVTGVGGYLVSGFLIFPAKPALEQQQQDLLHRVLKDGDRQLAQIRALREEIPNRHMRQKITSICRIAEKIFDTVKKNPEDVRSAQQFSAYYLETTLKIISRYRELSEHKAYSAEVQTALTKVEKMIDDVQGMFERQLSRLLRDDVLDLDTELTVLEETIELDTLPGEDA
ncbi:hypothetical protein GF339_10610 [candidate division KSB3 bacterium]|uniref:5-bromo-4-chloroindolyl phosphate hydrolysis protein n=1 Tax=candidate division KSB3 bacterium TaxID=2044937 RepID=A0A9D5JW55_9BACT|nr:hypothetical protein [candidate division KSB3 bacterium]MBD3325027.1 hypothetical protein [candidate division KSB3 bacterium]